VTEHIAKTWVETNFPHARGTIKAALILAYGMGYSQGTADAAADIEQFRDYLLAQGVTTIRV
jgi:hypothetical protein